ncbi:MAG: hypothetical protein J5896_03715 [Alphaproteobacteria bacterium]|nr:hypothetical protein [Alphaproteobacteria bacterium]
MKYAVKTCALLSTVVALSSCQTFKSDDSSLERAQEWQPKINMPSSIVVCRDKQCASTKLSMSREYIYNSLTHLLEQNANEKALVCQADALTHVCTEDYVTVPITVGVTPAHLYINNVEITDVSLALNHRSIDLLLNYGISYNGQTPTCKPAKSIVYVKNAQNIVMEDAGYTCKMTTIGNTTIKTLFAIDYIDLDYGFIGGYYSIGLSGPAYGGGSRYMMLKLQNDAYPLSPDLIMKNIEANELKAEALNKKEKELNKKEEELNKKEEALAAQAIMDINGEPVYVFGENEVFDGSECYSTVLQPIPCDEQWSCYEEPAVGKVICTEPQAENFTIITENGEKIERSKGVIEPKAIQNVQVAEPLDTKNIQPVKQQTTNMSVYNKPLSTEVKGVQSNDVQVFPIYKRKK